MYSQTNFGECSFTNDWTQLPILSQHFKPYNIQLMLRESFSSFLLCLLFYLLKLFFPSPIPLQLGIVDPTVVAKNPNNPIALLQALRDLSTFWVFFLPSNYLKWTSYVLLRMISIHSHSLIPFLVSLNRFSQHQLYYFLWLLWRALIPMVLVKTL